MEGPNGKAIKCYTWNELLELAPNTPDSVVEERLAAQRPGHCCALIYTSGTTGDPKVPPLFTLSLAIFRFEDLLMCWSLCCGFCSDFLFFVFTCNVVLRACWVGVYFCLLVWRSVAERGGLNGAHRLVAASYVAARLRETHGNLLLTAVLARLLGCDDFARQHSV